MWLFFMCVCIVNWEMIGRIPGHNNGSTPTRARLQQVRFSFAHDDSVKWNRSLVNSPHKGQWRGALIFSLIYGWVNNREADDLRRHRAQYGVTVQRKRIIITK